jgi:hypothetical protein
MHLGTRRTLFFTRVVHAWRLAFGIIGDDDMEHALAHIDKGTAGSKDKPRPKPPKKV